MGDPNDVNYGGGAYADMMSFVYPQIKAANPNVQVLIGGLLMDNPRTNCIQDCPARFFEGILVKGGGAYFDGVNFHAYDYYLGQQGQYHNPNWSTRWDSTGPALIAKAKFLRALLAKYHVNGKFLVSTEAALICGRTGTEAPCVSAVAQSTKASYVAQVYASTIAMGLRTNIWYSVLGWRGSGLLDASLNPLPAYTAYKVSRALLIDAQYVKDVDQFSGVAGYEYQRDGLTIWVIWSRDGAVHNIQLPSKPTSVVDVLGASKTPTINFAVDLTPHYLVWKR
jgi:hypothetical protein